MNGASIARSAALKWGAGAAGGGAGAMLGYEAIKAVSARPEFLPQLLSSGVLGFAALVVGMVIFRKQFESFNATQQRHAGAQEQLAANVGALVGKDDQRAREQDIMLDHLSRTSDRILTELRELRLAPAVSVAPQVIPVTIPLQVFPAAPMEKP
jgi:hypothetical protein